MILPFLVAQLADLLSFLVAVVAYPHLLEREIGLIGVIYERFGVLGAIVWKGGLVLLVAWGLLRSQKRYPKYTFAVAAVGFVLGLLGAAFNTVAFWAQTVVR